MHKKYHFSPITTIPASEGPGETPTRSQRERHLNVGQGGSPVPAPLARPHSAPTDQGLGAKKWSSWLSLAFITYRLCLLPHGLIPEAHSRSRSWFQKPSPALCLLAAPLTPFHGTVVGELPPPPCAFFVYKLLTSTNKQLPVCTHCICFYLPPPPFTNPIRSDG